MSEKKFVYMDSGATSWPKPQPVLDAVQAALTEYGANPGRGAYQMAIRASMEIFQARQLLTEFFHGDDAQRLIFTQNTTEGLNFALHGLLNPGDHILYTPLEHNAAWRPITNLESLGIEAECLGGDKYGRVSPEEIKAKLKANTKMMVCCHASNITGAVQPLAAIGKACRESGILLLVDAAQSAGILPIDIEAMNIDLLAAPGHKSLYGPMGTGILFVGERATDIRPLKQGGTGSRSHEGIQPSEFPDRLECGTLNLPGIAGLKAGVRYLMDHGMENVYANLAAKTAYLHQGLLAVPGLTVYGPPAGEERTTVVSVNFDGLSSNEAAFYLDQEYGIAVRAGFHCAPLGHKNMGTTKDGAVRFSLGLATSYEDLDYVIDSARRLAQEQQNG
jgi:cysteine desulfurase/selenocysteine lyase